MYRLVFYILIIVDGGEMVNIKSLAIKMDNKLNLSSFIYMSQKISHTPFYQNCLVFDLPVVTV